LANSQNQIAQFDFIAGLNVQIDNLPECLRNKNVFPVVPEETKFPFEVLLPGRDTSNCGNSRCSFWLR
jgi:hypothetical protein